MENLKIEVTSHLFCMHCVPFIAHIFWLSIYPFIWYHAEFFSENGLILETFKISSIPPTKTTVKCKTYILMIMLLS